MPVNYLQKLCFIAVAWLLPSSAISAEAPQSLNELWERQLSEVLEGRHSLDNAVWLLRVQFPDPAFTFPDGGSARSLRDRQGVFGRIEVEATSFGFPAKNIKYESPAGIGLARNPEKYSHRDIFFELSYYVQGNPETVIPAVARAFNRKGCDQRGRFDCEFRLEDNKVLKLDVTGTTTTSIRLTYRNPDYVPNPANQDCC